MSENQTTSAKENSQSSSRIPEGYTQEEWDEMEEDMLLEMFEERERRRQQQQQKQNQ